MPPRLQYKGCRKCGMPGSVRYTFSWEPNGTISLRMGRGIRMVLINGDIYDSLFKSLERVLDISLGSTVFDAQRYVSSITFTELEKQNRTLSVLSRTPGSKKLVINFFHFVATITGLCHSETIEYKPGEYGIARIVNPFHPLLVAADVAGAFEFLDGMPYDYKFERKEENEYILTVKASPDRPGESGGREYELPKLIPGDVKTEICSQCHFPIVLSKRLKWDTEEGKIIDTRTNSRMIFSPAYTVTSIFNVLANNYGSQVNELVVNAQRDWTFRHAEQLGVSTEHKPLSSEEVKREFRGFLRELPLLGQGNPVDFQMDGSQIKVKMDNPFDIYIIAGTLRGLYEALFSRLCSVDIESYDDLSALYTLDS